MSETYLIKQFEEARQNHRSANGWWKLLEKRDWSGSRFSLSHVHGTVKMMICGQESQGGTNYHESPACLNAALSQVLCRHPEIVGEAIALLSEAENEARIAAKTAMESVLSEIEAPNAN